MQKAIKEQKTVLIIGRNKFNNLAISKTLNIWLGKNNLSEKVDVVSQALEEVENVQDIEKWTHKLISDLIPTLVILEANLRHLGGNANIDTFLPNFFKNTNSSVHFILYSGSEYKAEQTKDNNEQTKDNKNEAIEKKEIVGTRLVTECKNILGCFYNGAQSSSTEKLLSLTGILNQNEVKNKFSKLKELDIQQESDIPEDDSAGLSEKRKNLTEKPFKSKGDLK